MPSGIAASDAAVSYTYSMKHNLPVEVSSSADWIKVSVTDDSFKVDLKRMRPDVFAQVVSLIHLEI